MSPEANPSLAGMTLGDILLKRRALKRRLGARAGLQPLRLAILGGSTTNEVADLAELYLLDSGFAPVLYQSEYGRFEVEATQDSAALEEFRPDLVYIHTSVRNIQHFAPIGASEEEFDGAVAAERKRFEGIWDALEEKLGCLVIQNNFEFPENAILGNLDASLSGGHTRFVAELNGQFARAAAARPRLLMQDVLSLAARIGLDTWFDDERYFSYKLVTSPEGSQALAQSVAALVRASYGRTRKVLVLDLDNTLWGGVIGDDGVEKIQIGRETPVAEAYTDFQQYCLALRNRGILLAVCSKNNDETARAGFEHPDSILKLEHISCFKANWNPKHENIAEIARELNLGADSFVFVDDNPAERAIVEGQVAGIAVPDVGANVADFARIIEAGRYFEQTSFSKEDLDRAALYQDNSARAAFESKFANYGEYLDSLEMTAEIEDFKPIYLDRITQLTNKTNQFNLTTRRYTLPEMELVMESREHVGIYGKLSDRFGDNGLISVVAAHLEGAALEIDLWLMSCRVLKRDMEVAMLDALVKRAASLGASTLSGRYIPSKKNGMVAGHYEALGFTKVSDHPDGSATYALQVAGYKPRNRHIGIMELLAPEGSRAMRTT